jgi:hypothetical protein
MATIEVTAKSFEAAIRKHLERDRERMIAATYEVAHRGQAYAVQITNEAGLVYLGEYKRKFSVIAGAARVGGAAKERGPAMLVNATRYAGVIEWGRRPDRPGPPVEPIRQWVATKLGLSGDELERATFLIRRHIHRHGSKPHRIMFRTYQQMRIWFKHEVERQLKTRGGM